MQQKSMTALMSMFVRAYHSKTSNTLIFNDYIAYELLGEKQYQEIATNLKQGTSFFLPDFQGESNQALDLIVHGILGVTPLGRSAYAERMLKNSIQAGVRQYLILASGYDTFAYRQDNYDKLNIFEIDLEQTQKDKLNMINQAGIKIPENVYYISTDFKKKDWREDILVNKSFDRNKLSFCSLLGITYYLTKDNLQQMFNNIALLIPTGSTVVFDYPVTLKNNNVNYQKELASAANEEMKASFTYQEIEKLLEDTGFLIYEHLNDKEITNFLFEEYNKKNSNKIIAPEDVAYCLAVKRE